MMGYIANASRSEPSRTFALGEVLYHRHLSCRAATPRRCLTLTLAITVGALLAMILERHRTIDDESPLIDDDWDFVVPRTMDPNEALSWELDRGYAIIGGRPSAWGRRPSPQ